jgi:hypothetical protein
MMSQEYDPVLSAKAWEFLSSLSKKRQQRITRLIYQFAEYPHQLGDYQTQDSTRRRLENIHLEGVTSSLTGPTVL